MSPPADKPVAAISNLSIRVAATGATIVDEITFEIFPGEVLGLVGESGSGKTTVALALLGYARRGVVISGGSVLIQGDDMLSLSEQRRRALRGRQVTYVPQDPTTALNPNVRVGTQLTEVLERHRFGKTSAERAGRVEELLREVALPSDELLSRYPHQLSGGQCQRIALAMAFACRPKVIVLDEPTTGLDVTTQAHILRTVRSLCEAHGVGALYVSHDLAVVANLATRVGLMYAGRLVEVAAKETFFSVPAHPYARRLLEAIPERSGQGELVGIPGNAPRPGRRPPGCTFADRCDFVVSRCLEVFPPVTHVTPRHEVRCFRYADVQHIGRTSQRRRVVGRRSSETEVLALAARHLDAHYADRQVLFDIDLWVPQGAILGIVGESGSGKTTLARCLAGLHRRHVGEITFRSRRLAPAARDRDGESRKLIQYIFQNPYASLNPRRTVGQSIGQPLRLFEGLTGRKADRRVIEALDHVSLDERVRLQYPSQLSGGERQRVAIARAIAAKPAILICDEISSALDVSVQATIVALIERLRAEMGLGVIFVTHNIALVGTIASEIVVMSQGRIVERGDARSVLDFPRDPYTQRLLRDVPALTQT